MTVRLKPTQAYFSIERLNPEKREVVAYGFVNEVVDGEGGIRLRRDAMEAATPDYMEWANIREMHDEKRAAGITRSVDWDKTGAKMTVKVVDDAAWQKCVEGVYKGLSVGVIPLVMRGKDVTKCRWAETSLVDRPADPDARILVVRAEGFEPGAEYDVEVEDDPVPVERIERADSPLFDAVAAQRDYFDVCSQKLWKAMNCLQDSLSQIAIGSDPDKEKLARKSIKQFADVAAPLIASSVGKNNRAQVSELQRGSAETNMTDEKTAPKPAKQKAPKAARTEGSEPITRAQVEAPADHLAVIERLKTEASQKDAKLQKAIKRAAKAAKAERKAKIAVKRLSAQPVPQVAPVRFTGAALNAKGLERTIETGTDAGADSADSLVASYKDLANRAAAEKDQNKREAMVVELIGMKVPLAQAGVDPSAIL